MLVTPLVTMSRQTRLRHIVTPRGYAGYATVTPNSVTPYSYATWLRWLRHRLRQIRLRHIVTPHVVTPRLRHMVTPVTPNTVTPHSYATCGYATVTPNSVTPHGYATYGTPSLASLRHPASLPRHSTASLHRVTPHVTPRVTPRITP